MKDVYVHTKLSGPSVRTMSFSRGGIVVNIDFNKAREVVGVEVIDAKKITVNGKRV